MAQELGLDGQAGVFPLSERFAQMGSIPANDDGGKQVEPSHAVMLVLAGAVRVTSSVGRLYESARWRALQMLGPGMFRLSVIRSSRHVRRCP